MTTLGTAAMLRDIVHVEGWRGLYKGLSLTWVKVRKAPPHPESRGCAVLSFVTSAYFGPQGIPTQELV